MSKRRSRRKIKKMIGYTAVGLVSILLIVLIVLGLTRTPGGEDPLVKNPVLVVDGVGYEKRRDLSHVLMIGVPDDEALGAQYLTLVTMDRTTNQYFITNIDYRIKALVEPLNVRVSTANEQGLVESAIGKAQTYGDGSQTSSWNTAQTVERMLDINISTVICLHVTGGEAPQFQSAPAAALSTLLADIDSAVATTGKTFPAVVADTCVWSDITGRGDFQNLLEQLNAYTCTSTQPYVLTGTPLEDGTYEVDQNKLNDLKIQLFLKKIDTEVTDGGES